MSISTFPTVLSSPPVSNPLFSPSPSTRCCLSPRCLPRLVADSYVRCCAGCGDRQPESECKVQSQRWRVRLGGGGEAEHAQRRQHCFSWYPQFSGWCCDFHHAADNVSASSCAVRYVHAPVAPHPARRRGRVRHRASIVMAARRERGKRTRAAFLGGLYKVSLN